MYSATFAITVIFCIAVTNLLFGFVAAILCGRGPRSLSELGHAIVFRPSAWRSAAQTAVVAMDRQAPTAPPAAALAAPSEPVADLATPDTVDPPTDAGPETVEAPAEPSPAPKLPRRPATPPVEDRPADVVLLEQLDEWRTEEFGDEMPSATMLTVPRPDTDLIDQVWPVLLKAIGETVTSQLRRDRRVLQFAENEFFWFTEDVSAEDALLPAKRIRHILAHTTFEYHGATFEITPTVAVVVVRHDDDAASILDRLRATHARAVQNADAPVAWDLGGGPENVEPIEIDLAPSSQVLVP